MQQVVVILIVAGGVAFLAYQGFRFFKPRKGGKACGGSCCDQAAPEPPPAGRTQMIASDDLRARVKARQS
jgi:hypothetical protein